MASKELQAAIESATLESLQMVLKQVCEEIPEAQGLLEKTLLAVSTTTSQESAGTKRPQYFLVCQNCEEEFDSTQLSEKSCTFHPGELEMDEEYDFWVDKYEGDGHGMLDPYVCDEYIKEFPEGFRWDCCDKTSEAAGCQIGAHEYHANFKPGVKKPKIGH